MATNVSPQPTKLAQIKTLFQRQFLKNDLIAGFTTALVGISSSMAYAAIAGINPIYGLFSAIIPTVIGGLFGSSNYLVTGPTNATALVTASILIGLNVAPDRYLDMVFLLAIMSGVFRLLLGFLHAGKILRFVSNAVLTGFISAVGILIIVGQLGNIFWVVVPKNEGISATLVALSRDINQLNPYVLGVAFLTIILIVVIQKVNNKLPATFLTIIIVSTCSYFLKLNEFGVMQVNDLGLPGNMHLGFYLPNYSFEEAFSLIPGAVALAIFTLVEGVSTAKSLAVFTNESFNASCEFTSQGLASIVGGFFQSMPTSGSPSRTMVNYSSGAKTKRATILSGVFLYIILILLVRWVGYIAVPSLAATIAYSGFSLLNCEHIKITWNTRLTTRLILIGSFLSTLFLPLQYSIYIGVGLSIFLMFMEYNKAHLTTLRLMDDGNVIERSYSMEDTDYAYNDIEILNVNGDLIFGVIEHFEDNIRHLLDQGIKVLIIRLRWVIVLGSTGVIAIIGLIKQAKAKNVKVIFVGVAAELFPVLEQAGIVDMVGEESIIKATPVVYQSLRKGVEIAENSIRKTDIRRSE